jgi:hypothetical protein
MSKRNGDKARFGRERQRKILLRKNTREVRRALEAKPPLAADPGPGDSQALVVATQADPLGA